MCDAWCVVPKKGKEKMKKLIIIAVAAVTSVVANAASVKWTAANVYSSDPTTKLAVGSTVSLYAAQVVSSVVGDYSVVDTFTLTAAGAVSKTSVIDSISANETWNFYYVFEDGGKAFTSAVKENVTIAAVGTTQVAFGNQQSATQNPSNWAAVPEPTSGLLLLLGMAGLALKRKRA